MLSFREFEAGPDAFGRKYSVALKWLQTAISLRHADAVDVKFILTEEGGGKHERTISLPHADLAAISAETGRAIDDAWCGRLARLRLEARPLLRKMSPIMSVARTQSMLVNWPLWSGLKRPCGDRAGRALSVPMQRPAALRGARPRASPIARVSRRPHSPPLRPRAA